MCGKPWAYIAWTKTLKNPDGSLQMPEGDTSIASYTYTREDENPNDLWARVEHGKDSNEGLIEGDIKTESEAIALGMKPYPIPDIEVI